MADPNVTARTLQKLLLAHTPAERLAVAQGYLHTLVADEDRETVEIILGALFEGKSEPVPIVVLVHGIRTNAQWQETAAPLIEKELSAKVVAIKYGVFDAFRFWFPFWFRGGPVKRILRELRDIHANTNHAPLYVIAHSYGTYSVADILRRHPDVIITRLLLCGAIIEDGFRWDTLPRCPPHILNFCGTRDMWPIWAKATSWGYGSTGTFGFGTARVYDAFFEVGHSGFFDEAFIRGHWLPFLIDGKRPTTSTKRPETSILKLWLQLFPGQWLAVAGALVVLWLWATNG